MVAIEIPFRDALALRRLVLRPEAVSDEATMYDEELAGTASTYGVLVDRFLVAIGTVMPDRHPSNPGPGDWRVREWRPIRTFGVAVWESWCLARWSAMPPTKAGQLVWCNARVSAAAFYAQAGFVRRGDEVNTAGDRPHYLMDRPLA